MIIDLSVDKFDQLSFHFSGEVISEYTFYHTSATALLLAVILKQFEWVMQVIRTCRSGFSTDCVFSTDYIRNM